jgi:NlpC/P60 family putative phage cell wall peptidase
MTPAAQRRVDLARSWIGTPYVHQASLPGAGCDCLGLIRALWRAEFGPEPQEMPAYTPDWSEASGREDLMAAGLRWFHPMPRDGHRPGEIILFRMREGRVAKHLGLAALRDGQPTFIHAYSGQGVVESYLTQAWARRIAARFAFPDPKDLKD